MEIIFAIKKKVIYQRKFPKNRNMYVLHFSQLSRYDYLTEVQETKDIRILC